MSHRIADGDTVKIQPRTLPTVTADALTADPHRPPHRLLGPAAGTG